MEIQLVDDKEKTTYEIKIKYLDDELSNGELKQLNKDEYLDGGSGYIPDQARYDKDADKQSIIKFI